MHRKLSANIFHFISLICVITNGSGVWGGGFGRLLINVITCRPSQRLRCTYWRPDLHTNVSRWSSRLIFCSHQFTACLD